MGNGVIHNGDRNHVFLCAESGFIDGFGNFFRFARAYAYFAFSVANDHESRETSVFTALPRLGYAVDFDELFNQAVVFSLTSLRSSVFSFFVCHNLLSRQNLSPASLAPSASAFTRPV